MFANLGLLFATGVGVGVARENNGAAGLASVVCFLIAMNGGQQMLHMEPDQAAQALAKLSIPVGILSGMVGGLFYNRFHDIRLPDYLSFFGGRRFVPIVSAAAGLALAGLLGAFYPAIDHGMDKVSQLILQSGEIGMFFYGFLNCVLRVTGLHHLINNFAWFVLGDYHGVTGDLARFFADDPTAGSFMSGYFPVFMFGLPAACLAMYRATRPERRKLAGGMLLSFALTSFLTGITEPVEFSFMFLAPGLFLLHAVLTGAAMALMDALHVKLGFGFSAGLFDYLLNFSKATHPLMLLPVGALYFVLYFGLFSAAIARFDLKTPGREEPDEETDGEESSASRGARFVAALGGTANLRAVDACITRLRLVVADQDKVDDDALRRLGARGLIRPSATTLQVVLGALADPVAGEIRAVVGGLAAPAEKATAEPLPSAKADSSALLEALGGAANLRRVAACSSRLRLEVASVEAFDEAGLKQLGSRGLVSIGPTVAHLIMGPVSEALSQDLNRRLSAG